MLRSGYSPIKQQKCLLNLNRFYCLMMFMVGVCSGVLAFSLMKTLFAVRKDNTPTVLRFSEETGLDMDDLEMLRQDHSKHEVYHKDEGVVAEKLSTSVRVLCLVLTASTKELRRLEAIKNTWGKRCNTLLFTSNFENDTVPVINLYAGTDKFSKWALSKSALKYVYIHYLSTHDWVLTTGDDTFVVVENLRYLLSNYSSSDALYFGCRLKKFADINYMSGGAGDCMQTLGVQFVDTRDDLGRGRFFPFEPKQHLIPGLIAKTSWFWNSTYYPPNTGLDCCSDTAITFHDIDAVHMYLMNYLVYHLRPFGVNPTYPLELPTLNTTSPLH